MQSSRQDVPSWESRTSTTIHSTRSKLAGGSSTTARRSTSGPPVGSRVPNLLAPADTQPWRGGSDPSNLPVVGCQSQRGRWSARRGLPCIAEILLALRRRVYRARTCGVRSPPQTTRRSVEDAQPERGRLTPPTVSMPCEESANLAKHTPNRALHFAAVGLVVCYTPIPVCRVSGVV